MGKLLRAVIGLVLVFIGALGLWAIAFPDYPSGLALKLRASSEPLATMLLKWVDLSNYLQKSNPAEYFGSLIAFFGLFVAGLFTLTSKPKA